MKIILASNSPRRKQLLEGLGLDFEVRTLAGVDESYPEGLDGQQIAQYISKEKAQAYLPEQEEDELVITADTIVYAHGEVLGKPRDYDDAFRMLRLLAGTTHEVITGVTLQTRQRSKTFACLTKVTFGPLADAEIDYYITHYKPFDKAGAYGIQEWIGYVAVTSIEGSFFNVMGLPVQRLYTELKSFLG